MKHPDGKDEAATVVPEYAEAWDKDVERRVIRKTDLILIPFMWLGYGLVYYDKAILGGAAVFGMTTDLHLRVTIDPTTKPPKTSTQRLSWATSLFYFGMLAGLFPLTYMFQRFKLGRVLGTFVILWGTTAMCTAAVHDWRGLYAQRFFLGFSESIVPTSFMVIISGYYTQAEQTWRQCLWYSATGAWTIIGALFNYGFAHITKGALKKWQYLYLMAGSLTVLYGVACCFLPNSPAQAWWLTEEEKKVAIERLRMSQMGVRCQKVKRKQILEAIVDVKVWIIAIMMGAAYVVNGAVSGFGPLIVSTFGWSSYAALLWQMPLGGVCFIMILLVGYLSLVVPNVRLIMLSCCCLPVIAGCTMIWKSTWFIHASAPIAGYTLIGFFAPVTSLIVSMGMANVAGASKKSFMASAIFVFYCVGNIVGPLLVRTETVAKHYPRLWTGVIVCYCILIVLSATLYVILSKENRRRDKLNLEEKEAERVAFDDLTDKENLHFRFPIRRAALRILSSPSTSFIARPRTIATFSPSVLRISKQSASIQFQRRWATSEAEAPVSKLQPTAQEEVENAIHADSAAPSTNAAEEGQSAHEVATKNATASSTEAPVETANMTEATEEAIPAAEEPVAFNDPSSRPRREPGSGRNESRPFEGRVRNTDPKKTIYIGNLFFDVTEDDLSKELSRFGTIENVKLIRDARGLSKGFGYISYENIEQATRAVSGLNQQMFEGRRLSVQFASTDASPRRPVDSSQGGPRNPPSKTLFIGNMSWEMTDRDLNELFRGISNVIDVRVAIDRRTGQPRGFAHADFTDVKSAMEAEKVLQGKETYGRKLRIDYSYGPSNAPRNQARDEGRERGGRGSYDRRSENRPVRSQEREPGQDEY